jgi:hypothetical protein
LPRGRGLGATIFLAHPLFVVYYSPKLTANFKRFVIAATEHLHRRISRMGDRIRQLEDALALLQAGVSKDPHPLLSEDAIIVDVEDACDRPQESEGEGTAEVSRALGTLSVSDHGFSRFFGSTGGSDLLLVCLSFWGIFG